MNKDKEINSLKSEIELLKQHNDRLCNGLLKEFDNFIDKERIIKYLQENTCRCCLECECNAGNLSIIIEKIKNGEFD